MSWQDKIDNSKFKIKTGDGKEFFPLLRIGSKTREYNLSTFEFISLAGTFVDRKKERSAKYELIFYFQGEDHLTLCDDFEKSANDSRFWTVDHPYYGIIKGQPVTLSRNDNFLNCTEITVEFWESIIFGELEKENSLADQIIEEKTILDNSLSTAYVGKTDLKPVDQNRLKQFIDKIDLSYSNLLDDTNYNKYQKELSSVYSSVDKVLDQPSGLIKDVSKLIDAPSRLVKSVEFRIKLMENLYNNMKGIIKFKNKNEKSFFEAFGASLLASVCLSVFNPDDEDYTSRKNIENVSRKINSIYLNYLQTLDEMQSPIQGLINGFSLDFNAQQSLNSIVNKTLFNLFDFAFKAKQERTIELEKDSNLIVLTHKYFGLDEEDVNLEKFRKLNNIVNKKVYGLKKGTVIKYLI